MPVYGESHPSGPAPHFKHGGHEMLMEDGTETPHPPGPLSKKEIKARIESTPVEEIDLAPGGFRLRFGGSSGVLGLLDGLGGRSGDISAPEKPKYIQRDSIRILRRIIYYSAPTAH